MEEKGLFLSSEDLLILVSSQQKSSILLPFFQKLRCWMIKNNFSTSQTAL